MWTSFLDGFWTAFSWVSIGWSVGIFCLIVLVCIIAFIIERIFD